jgi:DNA-binding Lrp family transcriptional regulator
MMHVWWNSPASGNDRLVLLAIADEADDDGRNAFPSVRRLADKVNCHTATVLRSVLRLEQAGELEVVRVDPDHRGRGDVNKYRVAMKALPSAEEIRARYENPYTDNARKMQRLNSKKARSGSKKRAHFEGETRAPMRADPRTPYTDPRKNDDGLARLLSPEQKHSCDECDGPWVYREDGNVELCKNAGGT